MDISESIAKQFSDSLKSLIEIELRVKLLNKR